MHVAIVSEGHAVNSVLEIMSLIRARDPGSNFNRTRV